MVSAFLDHFCERRSAHFVGPRFVGTAQPRAASPQTPAGTVKGALGIPKTMRAIFASAPSANPSIRLFLAARSCARLAKSWAMAAVWTASRLVDLAGASVEPLRPRASIGPAMNLQ